MDHPDAQLWRDRWDTEFSHIARYGKKSATVYTDASFHNGRFSYAISITTHKQRKRYAERCPAEVTNINEAELYAIMRATWLLERHIDTTGFKMIYVRTDSMNAVKTLFVPGGAHSETIATMRGYIKAVFLRNGWLMNIKHVRAHQKNNSVQAYMNNQADAMAKAIHNKK